MQRARRGEGVQGERASPPRVPPGPGRTRNTTSPHSSVSAITGSRAHSISRRGSLPEAYSRCRPTRPGCPGYDGSWRRSATATPPRSAAFRAAGARGCSAAGARADSRWPSRRTPVRRWWGVCRTAVVTIAAAICPSSRTIRSGGSHRRRRRSRGYRPAGSCRGGPPEPRVRGPVLFVPPSSASRRHRPGGGRLGDRIMGPTVAPFPPPRPSPPHESYRQTFCRVHGYGPQPARFTPVRSIRPAGRARPGTGGVPPAAGGRASSSGSADTTEPQRQHRAEPSNRRHRRPPGARIRTPVTAPRPYRTRPSPHPARHRSPSGGAGSAPAGTTRVRPLPGRRHQVGVALVGAQHPGHGRRVLLAELLVPGHQSADRSASSISAEPHLVQARSHPRSRTLPQQQVVALGHHQPDLRRHRQRARERLLPSTRSNPGAYTTSSVPRAAAATAPRTRPRRRCPARLAVPAAQPVQFGVGEVEAVHGYMRRPRRPVAVQGVHQTLGQGRLAAPGLPAIPSRARRPPCGAGRGTGEGGRRRSTASPESVSPSARTACGARHSLERSGRGTVPI